MLTADAQHTLDEMDALERLSEQAKTPQDRLLIAHWFIEIAAKASRLGIGEFNLRTNVVRR